MSRCIRVLLIITQSRSFAPVGSGTEDRGTSDNAMEHRRVNRADHLVLPELRLAAAGEAKGVEEGAAGVAICHGLELAALTQPVVLGSGLLEVH